MAGLTLIDLPKRPASSAHPVTSSPGCGRIPELDGVRALSVVFVLFIHLSYGRIPGGFLGVDIFFVLSGYLITMLLLRERERCYRVSLPRFYARRVLRIMPPLAIAVLLGIALNDFTGVHKG